MSFILLYAYGTIKYLFVFVRYEQEFREFIRFGEFIEFREFGEFRGWGIWRSVELGKEELAVVQKSCAETDKLTKTCVCRS